MNANNQPLAAVDNLNNSLPNNYNNRLSVDVSNSLPNVASAANFDDLLDQMHSLSLNVLDRNSAARDNIIFNSQTLNQVQSNSNLLNASRLMTPEPRFSQYHAAFQ